MNDALWTLEEVSQFLGIPKNTMYQWRAKGYGPRGIRMGKHVRYRRKEVESWLARLDGEL